MQGRRCRARGGAALLGGHRGACCVMHGAFRGSCVRSWRGTGYVFWRSWSAPLALSVRPLAALVRIKFAWRRVFVRCSFPKACQRLRVHGPCRRDAKRLPEFTGIEPVVDTVGNSIRCRFRTHGRSHAKRARFHCAMYPKCGKMHITLPPADHVPVRYAVSFDRHKLLPTVLAALRSSQRRPQSPAMYVKIRT